MALVKGKISEIPEDAVRLSRMEAIKYQNDLIHKWKHKWDVFAYKHGILVLSGASSIFGAYINSHYRKKLKLRNTGKIASFIPMVFLPACLSAILHEQYVKPSLVLLDTCPVCIEMRSAALQTAVGAFVPMVLAPVASYSVAVQVSTFNMPHLIHEPMKVFQLWKKQTRPIGNLLFAVFVGQALLASAVTHMEAQSVITVNKKLLKIEEQLAKNQFK